MCLIYSKDTPHLYAGTAERVVCHFCILLLIPGVCIGGAVRIRAGKGRGGYYTRLGWDIGKIKIPR